MKPKIKFIFTVNPKLKDIIQGGKTTWTFTNYTVNLIVLDKIDLSDFGRFLLRGIYRQTPYPKTPLVIMLDILNSLHYAIGGV